MLEKRNAAAKKERDKMDGSTFPRLCFGAVESSGLDLHTMSLDMKHSVIASEDALNWRLHGGGWSLVLSSTLGLLGFALRFLSAL